MIIGIAELLSDGRLLVRGDWVIGHHADRGLRVSRAATAAWAAVKAGAGVAPLELQAPIMAGPRCTIATDRSCRSG